MHALKVAYQDWHADLVDGDTCCSALGAIAETEIHLLDGGEGQERKAS